MQQRAAFCQAMIHYPKIILLDEPLGKLDAMTREKIRADFQKFWMVKKPTDIRRWLPILFSRLCFTCPS
jgi:NitT/TauT family transport system ATP-binding protein